MGSAQSKLKSNPQIQSQNTFPSKHIDENLYILNHTKINEDDISLAKECAKHFENIHNPFIIAIIPNKQTLSQLPNQIANISTVLLGTHDYIKRCIQEITKALFNKFNSRNERLYDGLIIMPVAFISAKDFLFDQSNETRHMSKIKNDIIFRLPKDSAKVYVHAQKCIVIDAMRCSRTRNYISNNYNTINDDDKQQSLNNIKHIIQTMNNKSFVIETVNIQEVIDDYLNLFTSNDNKYLESIYTQLQENKTTCNAMDCRILHRDQDAHRTLTAVEQILHKIHCLFLHSYDIGHTLKSDEQTRIAIDSASTEVAHPFYNKNQEIITMQSRLKNKYCVFKTLKTTKDRMHKFNQMDSLLENMVETQDKKFHFGYKFVYEERKQAQKDVSSSSNNSGKFYIKKNIIHVYPQYDTLKTELIQNEISSISIGEYKQEYKKALIYHQSTFIKVTYHDMTIQNILSLMIYCNFTELQHKFTETYWKYEKHTSFYHLGYFITQTVHKWGKTLESEVVKMFYHGMNNKLVFPKFINNVQIYCPLSTSSQKSVAVSFTECSDGLVIEFTQSQRSRGRIKQFSVGCFSDYPSESEHLFIENEEPLLINNIIESAAGYEYKLLLRALRNLDDILRGTCVIKDSDFVDPLAQKIIHEKLLQNTHKFITPYGQNIIDSYFNNQETFSADLKFNHIYSRLDPSLLHENGQFVNVVVINNLFPNIKFIQVENVRLSFKLIEKILTKLKAIRTHYSTKLSRIAITVSKYSKCSIPKAISEYNQQFMPLKFQLKEAQHNILRFNIDNIAYDESSTEGKNIDITDSLDSSNSSEYFLNTDSEDKHRKIKDWLECGIGLSNEDSQFYSRLFVNNKYDTINAIKQIKTEKELRDIGVNKVEDIKIILSKI
eukprot:67644_1